MPSKWSNGLHETVAAGAGLDTAMNLQFYQCAFALPRFTTLHKFALLQLRSNSNSWLTVWTSFRRQLPAMGSSRQYHQRAKRTRYQTTASKCMRAEPVMGNRYPGYRPRTRLNNQQNWSHSFSRRNRQLAFRLRLVFLQVLRAVRFRQNPGLFSEFGPWRQLLYY